jgi:hypothetical protein
MFIPERSAYEVLHLDPTASEEEIVRRAGQLRRRLSSEAEIAELRRAVQALTARAEDRALLSLLSHPRPGYAAPALERFRSAFRGQPRPVEEIAPPLLLDLDEFAELIGRKLVDELEPPPVRFESVNWGDEAEEIHLQSAEALWQELITSTRA